MSRHVLVMRYVNHSATVQPSGILQGVKDADNLLELLFGREREGDFALSRLVAGELHRDTEGGSQVFLQYLVVIVSRRLVLSAQLSAFVVGSLLHLFGALLDLANRQALFYCLVVEFEL